MSNHSLKYRPEIDGLRAVAILPVVFYHAKFTGFSGGFVGVDVFFVISGYLITSIILIEQRAGRFTLRNFYNRRIRRIFPALFVMMVTSYPIAFVLLGPSAMAEFTGSVIASTFFYANFYFLDATGYFDTAAEFKPLLHNWSLSVEEQFYLVFPLAMLLSWRAGPRAQVGLFGTIALISLALAQWHVSQDDAARAFFLIHTRLWELLAGALTAYWLGSQRGRHMRESGRFRHVALAGLAMILGAVVLYDNETAFPGVSALLPCLGAVLVIAFASPQSLAGKVLGWRPAVFVGLISYSLYLWHVPLLVFTRIGTGRNDITLLAGVCLVALFVAFLSWRYVERPVRQMHDLPPRRLFAATGLCMALLAGIGFAGVQTKGFRDFYLKHRLDAVSRANFERYHPQTVLSPVADAGCQFSASRIDAGFIARFEACASDHEEAVLVLGDSHARNVYGALRSTGRSPFLVALWRGGCRPFRPKPHCIYEAAVPFLEAHQASISTVILHVSGSHYIHDHRGEADSDLAFIDGKRTRIAIENISKTADYVVRLPVGLDVVWLGPFAEARVDLENPKNYSPGRLRFNPVSLELFDRLEEALKKEVESRAKIHYVSLVDALGFNTETLLHEGCITFSDGDHLSRCGKRLFGPKIADALERSASWRQ